MLQAIQETDENHDLFYKQYLGLSPQPWWLAQYHCRQKCKKVQTLPGKDMCESHFLQCQKRYKRSSLYNCGGYYQMCCMWQCRQRWYKISGIPTEYIKRERFLKRTSTDTPRSKKRKKNPLLKRRRCYRKCRSKFKGAKRWCCYRRCSQINH